MAMSVDAKPVDILRSDLAAFADPGTVVDFTARPDLLLGHWQQEGKQKEATFALGTRLDLRDTFVTPAGAAEQLSYPSFLAGAAMADLRGLARNTLNVV